MFLEISDGGITSPKGYSAGGLHCGIKHKRADLAWCCSHVPATAAAVYTTNRFKAAPLLVNQESIAVEQKIQAILVNSGIANACTGKQGLRDAYKMQQIMAAKLHIPNHYVAIASTGLIGERLPMDAIKQGVAMIGDWKNIKQAHLFEQAILTTDLITKNACAQVTIDGCEVTIGGAAKGSGMINPNMATMLSFITTDANIDRKSLQQLLKQVTDESFNMIVVDGDTSTNDMVLTLANGSAGNECLSPQHPQWDRFKAAFTFVAKQLAKKVARDGEGATKLIEVEVKGAATLTQARAIAKTIISSNLVKAAIFGMDPNWGRIVCAVGYSGQEIDPDRLMVKIGPIIVFQGGTGADFSENEAVDYLQQPEIKLTVDLGLANDQACAWGCDLTYDYVKINAAYRT